MAAIKELTHIVQHEVEDYARGETFGGFTFPISDMEKQAYSMLIIPDKPKSIML